MMIAALRLNILEVATTPHPKSLLLVTSTATFVAVESLLATHAPDVAALASSAARNA